MAQQQAKKSNVLPGKENQLFKSIIKFYEAKQYKKGLKAADQILKKYPEHGETLSMKGLILNCLERKTEAYDFVRKGLKNDLTSHVCWHVYGLLYRSDREYNEAIKCYKNALKHDKDNKQILRDLSLLQIHTRDLEGFIDTRRKLLVLEATRKQNWISFAIGSHLQKNYKKALNILDEYEATMENPQKPDFETSEFHLYKNMIIEESGDLEGALTHLEKVERQVLDKIHLKEKRAELFLRLKKYSDAEKLYRDLVSINPDNHDYHTGLRNASQLENSDGSNLTSEQQDKLVKLYDELAKEFPKSDATHRIPLSFITGDLFKDRLHKYVAPRLRKGIPSLFTDLKSLYKDPSKIQITETLFTTYKKNLEENSTLLNETNESGQKKTETPMVIFWVNYYLAQHYDYLGNTDMALKLIDSAIMHTPTVIELYTTKARIYKHAGNLQECSKYFEKAREMDLADRYLNTKSVIHLIRTDQIEKATSAIGLFISKDVDDTINHLIDMQCNWFVQELAESYYRTGNLGMALKRFLNIDKHFNDFIEDQFDFHTYCLRKMTLRAYIKMIRHVDNIFGQKFYVKAAKWIIKTYLHLQDHPYVEQKSAEEAELEKLTPEERQKILRKKNKAEKKKQEKEAEEVKPASGKEKDVKKKVTPVDNDPDGKQLLQVADKLALVTKYLQKVQRYATSDIEIHLLSSQLYLKKKKYLLVLQSLKRAAVISPNDPDLHRYKILFLNAVKGIVDGTDTSVNAAVREVLKSEVATLLGGKTIAELNQSFLNAHILSLHHRAVAAEMMFLLDSSKKAEALKLITNHDNVKGKKDLKECARIHAVIRDEFKEAAKAEEYCAQCQNLFPYALYFMTKEEREKLTESLKEPEKEAEETNPAPVQT